MTPSKVGMGLISAPVVHIETWPLWPRSGKNHKAQIFTEELTPKYESPVMGWEAGIYKNLDKDGEVAHLPLMQLGP